MAPTKVIQCMNKNFCNARVAILKYTGCSQPVYLKFCATKEERKKKSILEKKGLISPEQKMILRHRNPVRHRKNILPV